MAHGGSKWHPLHTALIFGELDKAKRVFEDGGHDPHLLTSTNSKGWAALHFASHSGQPDSASTLVMVHLFAGILSFVLLRRGEICLSVGHFYVRVKGRDGTIGVVYPVKPLSVFRSRHGASTYFLSQSLTYHASVELYRLRYLFVVLSCGSVASRRVMVP